MPWILVPLLFLVPANRNRRALGILIPLGALALILVPLGHLFRTAMGGPGELPVWSALGLAMVWLVAHRLPRSRVAAWFVSLGVMLLPCLAGILAAGWDGEAVALLIAQAITATVILLALVLAGVSCRKRYGPGKFAAFVPLYSVGLSLVAALPFMIMAMVSMAGYLEGPMVMGMLVGYLVVVPLVGLLLTAISLAFILLVFKNGLYRDRFHRVFRLPGMLPPPASRTPSLAPPLAP